MEKIIGIEKHAGKVRKYSFWRVFDIGSYKVIKANASFTTVTSVLKWLTRGIDTMSTLVWSVSNTTIWVSVAHPTFWNTFPTFLEKDKKKTTLVFSSCRSLKNISLDNIGKVHVFWEGHKILRNLHLTLSYVVPVISKVEI